MAEFRRQQQATAKEFFGTASTILFETHAILDSFCWRQYTPFFNDGDTCHFGANTDEIDFTLGGEEFEYVGRSDADPLSKYGEDAIKTNPERCAAVNDVLDFLDNFDSDDLETLFGDHAEITVSRDGVSVDEYSHD
jgi:hypothetical protein